MSELFDLEETLSPRDEWKRLHDIATLAPRDDGQKHPTSGTDGTMWLAVLGPVRVGAAFTAGETEDQALLKMASLIGVEFYRELPSKR